MTGNKKNMLNFASKKPTMTTPTIDSCIAEAIKIKGIVDIDANDFKIFMDNFSIVHPFLEVATGESSLAKVFMAIRKRAKQHGFELFDCKRILISISISSQGDAIQKFTMSQLDALNSFIAHFYESSELRCDETRVLLLAC
mgnify:FL=1